MIRRGISALLVAACCVILPACSSAESEQPTTSTGESVTNATKTPINIIVDNHTIKAHL